MPEKTIDRVLVAVRADIEKARKSPANLMNAAQFEKGGGVSLVVRTNLVHAIARARLRELKKTNMQSILDACEALFESPPGEANIVAVDWSISLRRTYTPKDFARFERWLRKYVHGWGLCDAVCCGPLGLLLADFQELAPKTRRWVTSKNLWLRRAAAVALIPSVSQGKSFELAKEIADKLLPDPEDYVQKGYGWLLKVASGQFQREVFEFVMQRRDRMPRTALRYAIEKMPQAMRQKAMAKV